MSFQDKIGNDMCFFGNSFYAINIPELDHQAP